MRSSSIELVREAFVASGEKHFALARMLYRALFGPRWRDAMLGFAYLKCLDDLVDEDPDAANARAVVAEQLSFMERIYSGRPVGDDLDGPARYGLPFFAADRRHGAPLRAAFEAILATMDFDTRRRGTLLSAAALDAYVLELGGSVLRFLMHFACPDVAPPPHFVRLASRAYLNADSLMDLRHDLGFGLINVPREDVQRLGLVLDPSDDGLRRWIEQQAGRVLATFEQALAEGRRLESRAMRLLSRLYLSSKRRQFRRFLARDGLAPVHAGAAGFEGST